MVDKQRAVAAREETVRLFEQMSEEEALHETGLSGLGFGVISLGFRV